jgi:hypothetical protein
MPPRRFQEDDRARRVDGEVGQRLARGPVVRGLRGRVHDHRDVAAVVREELTDTGLVADVQIGVPVAAHRGFQPLPVPSRATRRSEEVPAHVVVDADDVEALRGEERRRFRSDEAGRAGDDGDRHNYAPCLVPPAGAGCCA